MYITLVIWRGSYFPVFCICLQQLRRCFYGNFYQNFSCTFSKVWTLVNIRKQLSSKLSSSQRLFDIKKVNNLSYLSKVKNISSHINPSWKPSFKVFLIFLKRNGINSFFCIEPQERQFHEPTLHFPRQLKKANHIDISLTGSDYCNSKLSNKK